MKEFLLIMLAGSSAQLDAPINTVPTVRSEILRGWNEVAFRCPITPDNIQEPEKIAYCALTVQEANRSTMSNGYEAFELGATFQAWHIVFQLSNYPDTETGPPIANKELAFVTSYENKFNITDKQLFDVVELNDTVAKTALAQIRQAKKIKNQ